MATHAAQALVSPVPLSILETQGHFRSGLSLHLMHLGWLMTLGAVLATIVSAILRQAYYGGFIRPDDFMTGAKPRLELVIGARQRENVLTAVFLVMKLRSASAVHGGSPSAGGRSIKASSLI